LAARHSFPTRRSPGLLACLLAEDGAMAGPLADPLAPRPPHFAPKARRVIQIFCPGAVSAMDTFEHKPELQKRHGQPMPGLTGVRSEEHTSELQSRGHR